jgi:uncharacterized protein
VARPLLLAFLLALVAGCGQQAPAKAQPQQQQAQPQLHFPALTGRVVDAAHLLAPADTKKIETISQDIEQRTKAQLVVATVASLEGQPISDYGLRLGRFWGVGRKGVNDGLLILVAPKERQVRIEVGYGLGRRVTNRFAAKVIDETLVPAFRDRRFGPGIAAASAAIEQRLLSAKSDAEIAREDQLP